jgi:integration host factor subunit beta
MTKSELIEKLTSDLPHLNQLDAEMAVKTIFSTMTEALKAGDRIEIRGFGSFSVRHRKERMGRNPKTGVIIPVPAKRVPFFTVGNELRTRVNSETTAVASEGQI